MSDTTFDREQFNAIYPEGIERHYWNRCRNRVIVDMLQRIHAKGPVLEVGCGKGLVVAALREEGFDVRGVELAEVEVIPQAREHVATSTDALSMDEDQRRPVRTVLLLDVIEHLEDPVSFIDRIRQAFPALEWILVTVPARQELFSNYDTFNRHFRRYDEQVLHQHLDPTGTREWHWSYFFHALYPAARLLLRIKGGRPPYFSVPAKGFPSLVHRLLGWSFHLEYRTLPAAWKGTSMIAVVRNLRAETQ